jgi:hypothetical protein
MRQQSGLRHRLGYRRFLEVVIREWAPKYAKASGIVLSAPNAPTAELLSQLFPEKILTALSVVEAG